MNTSTYCNIKRRSLSQDPGRARTLAEILKALSHPLRLRIIALLADAPTHVTAMAETLGAPQAVISQQLRILRMRGLVEFSRKGGYAVYCLGEPRLRELLRCMEGCSPAEQSPEIEESNR